ncbi:acyl-CoA thioesterase [Planosporangium sp. 12N6]|uniref:acyl-CoA thioesterase n=1 Tax=Planosporangium spinosum TaxID=3402278 RepID=UPI003CF3200E
MPRYTYHCALRWSDMDAYGHVNNARFLTLYEEARVAMMFTGAREAGVTSLEGGVVIARHEIDYLRPVDYGAESVGATEPRRVRIDMWLEEIRPSRFVVAYELFDDGALASRARSVCVPFDLAAGRPRRLSDAERAYLTPWLSPAGPGQPA